MKLKQWLRESKQMTYAEYRALEDIERWQIFGEFQWLNRVKQIHDSQNWRPMTDVEKEHYLSSFYEETLKVSGVYKRI